MITLEDLIGGINAILGPDKTLVLHRGVKNAPVVKIFKVFFYDLYLVNGSKPETVLNVTFTMNAPIRDLQDVQKHCDKRYVEQLMLWVASEDFKKLRDATIQQIPNSFN